MKLEWNKKYTTIAVYACLVITFGVVCVSLVFNLDAVWGAISKVLTILNPVIYGFAIAFLINPIFKLFYARVFAFTERRKPHLLLRKVLSLIAAYLVVAILISAFALIVVPQIGTSYTDLESKMGGYVAGAQKWVDTTLESSKDGHGAFGWLSKVIDIDRLTDNINNFISDSYKYLSDIVPYVTTFITNFIDVVKNALIGLIISVYFLYSRDRLCAQVKKTLFAFVRKEKAEHAIDVTRFTSRQFERFISGKLLDSLIIGVLTFIVLKICVIPYPALIAVIVGVTNIIPFFGPFIGAIPSAFIIFIAEPVKALWFILIIIIIQQLDGNVIGPMILGDRTGLSALWIIISLLLMGGVLGITGMFIGVPVFAVVYALFASHVAKRLQKKELDVDTEAYIRCPTDEPPEPHKARIKALELIHRFNDWFRNLGGKNNKNGRGKK